MYATSFASRSILASAPGYLSVQLLGPRLRKKSDVAEALARMIPEEQLNLGHCELCVGGAVVWFVRLVSC